MKHALVKDHIIKTASDLFYNKGYNLTGINEIIKTAGIAKATLYNHFKSKEEICIAYLQYKNTHFLEDIKTYVSNSGKGKTQLLSLFDYLDKFYKSNSFNGCWCINTISEIPKENTLIRNEIIKQKKNLIAFFKDLILKNIDTISASESDVLAKQIYILYEGAVAESHLQNDNWPIQSAKSICKSLL